MDIPGRKSGVLQPLRHGFRRQRGAARRIVVLISISSRKCRGSTGAWRHPCRAHNATLSNSKPTVRMATIVRYPRFRCRGARGVRRPSRHVPCWFLMRDPETIETELMEISAIADDAVKLERIIAWCSCPSRRSTLRSASAHEPARQERAASLKATSEA